MSGRRFVALRLTIEAGASLALARLVLRLLPFRRFTAWFERAPSAPAPGDRQRAKVVAQVQRAIRAAAPLLPGDTVCFPRAIAAQAMLRRRGIATTLYYGATARGGLKAHVWLQDGARGVVGLQAAPGHHVLARYTPHRRPTWATTPSRQDNRS